MFIILNIENGELYNNSIDSSPFFTRENLLLYKNSILDEYDYLRMDNDNDNDFFNFIESHVLLYFCDSTKITIVNEVQLINLSFDIDTISRSSFYMSMEEILRIKTLMRDNIINDILCT